VLHRKVVRARKWALRARLRWQQAKTLFDGDAVARELVVRREACRMSRARHFARGSHFFKGVDTLAILR